jgi:hypothetical protein
MEDQNGAKRRPGGSWACGILVLEEAGEVVLHANHVLRDWDGPAVADSLCLRSCEYA